MKLVLPTAGRYIICVSGGVDSVCLLDILAETNRYDLMLAHFDHGIRENSHLDRELVRGLSQRYGLPFICGEGKLGPKASEALARDVRYRFMFKAQKEHKALAVITAHHQDDRLETLLINLIRGTSPRGLASIQESDRVKRPLLNVTKAELKDYANSHGLVWREDETNAEDVYLRNYIRLHLLPRLRPKDRQELIGLMDAQIELNRQIETMIKVLLNGDNSKLSRSVLFDLDFSETKEVLAFWLRENNLFNFDRRTIERLALGVKTKRPGTKLDVKGGRRIQIKADHLALSAHER